MANGRRKGSAFERKMAAIIAKHFGVSVKECYRTPLSGGHPYADKADLVMSPELLLRFPYAVECKHTKAWRWTHLFSPTALMAGWAKQVLFSSSQCDRKPVIVFRGTGGPIFAATRPDAHWVHDYEKPVCLLHLAGKSWIVQPLEQWLKGLEVAGPKPKEGKRFFTYERKPAPGKGTKVNKRAEALQA